MTPKELASRNGNKEEKHSLGTLGPTDVPDSPLPSDEIPGRPLGNEL